MEPAAEDITHEHAMRQHKRLMEEEDSMTRSKSTPAMNTQDYQASSITYVGGFRKHHIASNRGSFLDLFKVVEDPSLRFRLAGIRWDDGSDDDDSMDMHEALLEDSEREKTYLTFFKSFVGPGVLALPKGFATAGLGIAIPALVFVAVLATGCMLLLLKAKKGLIARGHRVNGFGDIGFHLYGRIGRRLVNGSIFTSQFGFCCAYMIFVSSHIQDVVLSMTNCATTLNQDLLILITTGLCIPLVWIRKLRYFAITNLIADFFILFGLFYILGYDANELSNGEAKEVQVAVKDWALFVGIATYTFEGIAMVIPIEESMANKEELPRILLVSMTCITVIFVIFGTVNYYTFGDNLLPLVTLNLPHSYLVVDAVQIMYALAVMFTYPLMLFPATAILENYLAHRIPMFADKDTFKRKWAKNSVRAALVVLTALVAVAGKEELDKFIAILGGSCCVPLAFIYPSIFFYKTFKDEIRPAEKYFTLAVFGFGIVACAFATTMGIIGLISDSEVGKNECVPQ